ncbi:MAG: hypothetical protein II863_14235 [Kiritimatiellae bacterium]|nr:hypothetical protein [Kiritimatiellia bacterium]
MKKLVTALIVAGTALALHAAVHEDDWLKVETPDKVVPDSGFQVKVTLKKDLGPSENVTVAMHTFKTDGGWMGTGEWRPPQTMKKGETKVFAFTAKGSDKVGHFGPLAFIAPNGDWGKATHKIFCGKITWAMSGAEAAKRKAEAEAKAARAKPPAGITYKKSWIVPRGCCKPGTDEPVKEIREGESFDVVADYYLDPSEYWNNKCHVVVFGCGPWIDNPDGVHEKSSHHVNYPGAGWGFREVKPGKGTVRVTQKIKKFFRYNSLFFHVRFRGGDDKDFPWTKTCGAPKMVRPINGLDIVAPTAGGLFVAGREKPVVDLIAGSDAKAGSPVTIKILALDAVGKLEEVGSVSATMPDPGKTAKVDLSSAIGKRLGCFLAEGRSGDNSVDAFFGVIPDVDKALGGRRAPFGATDLYTDLECETAAKLGFSVNRMFVNWGALVPKRGEYRFDGISAQMDRQERHGIKPWLMLVGAPEWVLPPNVHSPGFEPYPFDEAGWRESIRAISQRFGKRVFGIEWLNEITPGNKSSNPAADYSRFCEIGTEELRKVNPKAHSMLAGGLWPRNFRLDVLGAGIGKHVDILPIHYGEYESAAEAITDAAAGGIKTVWNDESAAGISVWGMDGREALERSVLQSRNVLRVWPAQLVAGVKGIIYFGGEANPAGNWKYLLDDYTPRPVAATLAVMSAKLGNARPVGAYYAEPGARVMVFERKDGTALAVVGSANGDEKSAPVEVNIPATSGSTIVSTDHQGNERTIAAKGDTISIKAGAMPLIYEGLPLTPLAVRCTLTLEGQGPLTPKPSVSFVKGAAPQVRVSVRNPLRTPVEGVVGVAVVPGGKSGKAFSLAPGESAHFILDLPSETFPSGSAKGVARVAWKLGGGKENVMAQTDFAVDVIDPATLGNLLLNGGFEAKGGSKESWNGGGRIVKLDGSRPGEDGNALSLDHGKGWIQLFQRADNPSPGRKLLYTAWMRTDNMNAGSNASLVNSNGSSRNLYMPDVFTAPKDTHGAWQFMVKVLNSKPDDVKVQVQPVASGENGGALYDNIRLTLHDGTDWATEAHRAAKARKIDGDLSDWDFADPIPLLCANQIASEGGYKWTPDNLSGIAQLAWDDEALYMAVRVRDDVHSAQTGENTLRGDALQIGLHPANRLAGTDSAAIEWWVSAANPGSGSGKHTVYRPAAHAAGLASGQLAKDSSVYEIAVVRKGSDTCYEFRIPWRDAGGIRPQPGQRLGLSLRLTDTDSGAARGAAAWGRGLESWAPSSFGSLVLLP